MNANWHHLHPMPKNATLAQRVAWHRAHSKQCACRPIPPPLVALVEPARRARTKSDPPLRDLLAGGDRRAVARSSQALARIRGNPSLVRELVALANDDDWLVSMRALDLIEKLGHEHADWISPHKQVLIRRLADSDKWEIRLQIVRALPLFEWTLGERRRVVQILSRDANHSQVFVRAWALDGLATLARRDASLMPEVRRGLRAFEASGRPALTTRARHIRQRLLRKTFPRAGRGARRLVVARHPHRNRV